jgi:two-component system phosphate regulon response regulator PhoB
LNPRILIVEDEAPLTAMLRYNFEREGYRVAEAGDGEAAMVCIAEQPPDLVVLDWMLPVTSGLEVCRRLKRAPGTRALPVIMLTAKGEEADRVRGLDTGADDYLTKPFSVAELLARVRAVLRRAHAAAGDEAIACGGLEIDLAAKRVRRNGREAHLGPTEFRLLHRLMADPGRVYSRAQLLDTVWEHNLDAGDRTVDQSIRRLREALNAPGQLDLIRTVRAEGYALRVE